MFAYYRTHGRGQRGLPGRHVPIDQQTGLAMQPVVRRFRWDFVCLAVLGILTGFTDGVLAGAGLMAQSAAPVSNVVSGRSYTVEIGIVVVMFGGALFAVCRSSNRT